MKRIILMTASLAAIALGTQKAQAQTDTDSLRMEELQEVVVRGVQDWQGTTVPLCTNTRRAGMERERSGNRHNIYAHPRCWRLAHQRHSRRCATQLSRRPMRVLGKHELLCFAPRLGADTTRRGNIDKRRRRFRWNDSTIV